VLARTSYTVALCGLLVGLSACGDEPPAKPESAPEPIPAPAPPEPPAPPPAPKPPEPPTLEAFPAGDDEAAALRKIRSLPAWSAALERYRLLGRRGQSGPIHGLLVETESGLRLVDESIGDGALSIPVALLANLPRTPPMRAVLWGAWQPEQEPSWRWHVTKIRSLEPRPTPFTELPALEPLGAAEPKNAVLPSKVARRGGTISFVVKKQSERVGDGWLIADDSKGKAVARLLLPGERETYGDQSELADDERWKLGRNTRYWVTIRSFRSAPSGDLPVFRARSAPNWDKEGSAAPAKAP
jgi:hypothetical protein